MPEPAKCRITVLKRTFNRDLVDEYLVADEHYSLCDQFRDGQEFLVVQPYTMPEGFCPWAWADIRGDIMMVSSGGNPPWIKRRGTTIAGCTDWFRPVIFRIERID